MIESKISIRLASFEVPSLVREAGPAAKMSGPPCAVAPAVSQWYAPALSPREFQLAEIPSEELLKMCEDFKKEVFKRAGKSKDLLAYGVAEAE